MEEYIKKLNDLVVKFNEKENKKYALETLMRLLKKLETETDEKASDLVDKMIEELNSLSQSDELKPKVYLKLFSSLKKHVKEKYGYVERGSVQNEYMAMGVALGLVFGVAFTTINSAYIAIGLPIGIAIGLSIGSSKEKELDKKNKLY